MRFCHIWGFITIKGFATSFPSLTLHAVNLLLWRKILSLTLLKIIAVIRPSTLLRVFFMGAQDLQLRQGSESFPFPSCLTPNLLWLQTTYWKKVFLIAFRQILSNILSVVHIFMIKNWIRIKSFFPEFYPLYSPSCQKCSHFFHIVCRPDHGWTALPLPPTTVW